MRFKEVLGRLTGISCPIFGVSWNPSEADVTIARKVITFLGDRRVLYSPSELEVPDQCISSIVQIRSFLTDLISSQKDAGSHTENLRAMRAACRKFLNTMQAGGDRMMSLATHRNSYQSWVFNGALGELRGVFGLHIAQLAAQHGLDVEDDLSAILPAADDANNGPESDVDAGE